MTASRGSNDCAATDISETQVEPHSRNVYAWSKLYGAVIAQDWELAEAFALDLSNLGDVKHVDGVYKIGFQHLTDAPDSVRKAIDIYHSALILMRRKTGRKKRKKGNTK